MGRTETVCSKRTRTRKARLSFARQAASTKTGVRSYEIGDGKVIATDVFDTFWKFAAERKAIYDKRVQGEDAPWTDDPVLQSRRFCNTFRVTDATCQYMIRYVIKAGSQAPAELVFRVVLFDTFTRTDTWEYIIQNLGAPTWETYDRSTYTEVLCQAREDGRSLYTGSFQKPAPDYGHKIACVNHLHALEVLMKADLPGRLVAATRMADIFDWLRTFKGMGDFNTYQLLLNLSYTGLGNFSDADSFVILGCGARAGLNQCFRQGLSSHARELDVVRWMQRTQRDHFSRLGLSCTLGPPDSPFHEMGVCDIEHTLCEVDKYIRPDSRRFQASKGPTLELTLPQNPSEDQEERWVIDRITGKRDLGVVEYQVYWEGYDDPTWEPAEIVEEDAPLAVKQFLKSV